MSNLSKVFGVGVVEYFDDVRIIKDQVKKLAETHDVSIKIFMEDLDTMLKDQD